MKKYILLFLFVALLANLGFSQTNYWTALDNATNIPALRNQKPDIQADKYALFELEFNALEVLLERKLDTNKALHIAVPLPDGTVERFAIKRGNNLPSELAEKYPSIQSFKGAGVSEPSTTIRGSLSTLGFHAVISKDGQEIYIDPYSRATTSYHMVYFTADDPISPEMRERLQHDHSQFETTPNLFEDIQGGRNSPFAKTRSNNVPVVLYKYQIAIAATGEYTQFWGGTKEGALSAINVALDRVNSIFIQEAAIELNLVANNDTLIYTNADTDPFTGTNPGVLTQESPGVINQSIGFSSYDIGHVFTRNCEGDAAGVSGGVGTVCGASKARGSSCQTSANDAFYVRIICHELGHQFGGFHTWNNCPPSNDDPVNYNPLAAFEPGSGSTIMSYSGSCQDQNVVFNPDPYYHVNTLEAIQSFTRGGVGEACAELVPTTNTQPAVIIPFEDGLFIPISTPFKLRAEGMDADGDDLTYCWEQYDRDLVISSLGTPQGNDPSFRSVAPTASPTRYLPTLTDLIANRTSINEVLPTYARDLTFRCTVRDNDPEAGGVAWKEVKFKATDQAGPFVVTSPNNSRLDLEAGSFFEVSWDVANTNVAPVNSQFVNIRLSLDAGQTYPIVLAENTPNNGSTFVTLPDTIASFARLMVEATDNIFFDINDFNFRIVPPVDTSLSVNVAPVGIPLHCQPEPLNFEIKTQAINGYAGQLALQLVGDLPEGADYSFSSDQIAPGESSTLTINLNEQSVFNTSLTIIGTAPGLDTLRRPIYFTSLANNFDDLIQLTPVDGTNNILLSTPFSWTDVPNASTYDLEIATSPIFGETIVESASSIDTAGYAPASFLADNELFFWRIRPLGACGASDWLAPFTFHTAIIDCQKYTNSDRVNISGTGLPTIESKIEVEASGIINDLNIPFIRANYQGVNSLRITLISPAGTEVIIYDQNCGATANLRIGFDDNAPSAIVCPPDDAIVFKPINPLSAFIGENTQGTWTLKVAVIRPGFGASGALEEWNLEFCSANQPSNPTLVNNDTLFVPPNLANTITPNELIASDEDNSSDELIYTLVSAPAFGTLSAFGETLAVGDQFNQRTIETFELVYQHNGADNLFDAFSFVIEDGTGGFLPIRSLPIKIDANAVVDTEDILGQAGNLSIFPNPVRTELLVDFGPALSGKGQLRIYNAQGQLRYTQRIDQSVAQFTLPVDQLEAGLHVLSFVKEGNIESLRFIKQ